MPERVDPWLLRLRDVRDRRDRARTLHEEAVTRSEAALAASRAALRSVAHIRPARQHGS